MIGYSTYERKGSRQKGLLIFRQKQGHMNKDSYLEFSSFKFMNK